ncbi:MAG: transcriptional repressor [Bdellovibrionaceae bacterium]|nr:transcriptional repressor [Pseudobdellovibrionaceae bacterium]
MKNKAFLSTDLVQKKLQEAGVQPTLQRIAICKYVLCEGDHPTAEQVTKWAEKNLEKISQATVYNTLNTLVDAGLLRTFKLPHSEKVIYDCNTHDHYHFLDEASGSLYDIEAKDVSVEMKMPHQFKVNSMEIVFKGNFKS